MKCFFHPSMTWKNAVLFCLYNNRNKRERKQKIETTFYVIRIVCKRINLEVIRRDALAFRHLFDLKRVCKCVIEFFSNSVYLLFFFSSLFSIFFWWENMKSQIRMLKLSKKNTSVCAIQWNWLFGLNTKSRARDSDNHNSIKPNEQHFYLFVFFFLHWCLFCVPFFSTSRVWIRYSWPRHWYVYISVSVCAATCDCVSLLKLKRNG